MSTASLPMTGATSAFVSSEQGAGKALVAPPPEGLVDVVELEALDVFAVFDFDELLPHPPSTTATTVTRIAPVRLIVDLPPVGLPASIRRPRSTPAWRTCRCGTRKSTGTTFRRCH